MREQACSIPRGLKINKNSAESEVFLVDFPSYRTLQAVQKDPGRKTCGLAQRSNGFHLLVVRWRERLEFHDPPTTCASSKCHLGDKSGLMLKFLSSDLQCLDGSFPVT
jgi:hypothetical protein